jgi:hypothetical protein
VAEAALQFLERGLRRVNVLVGLVAHLPGALTARRCPHLPWLRLGRSPVLQAFPALIIVMNAAPAHREGGCARARSGG